MNATGFEVYGICEIYDPVSVWFRRIKGKDQNHETCKIDGKLLLNKEIIEYGEKSNPLSSPISSFLSFFLSFFPSISFILVVAQIKVV